MRQETTSQARQVGQFGTVGIYRAGIDVFRQDEPCGAVYLIREGAVKLVRATLEGKELLLGLRWSGSYLGAASEISGSPSVIAAVTLTTSVVERIPGETFRRLAATSPQFALAVAKSQSAEIAEQLRTQIELLSLSAKSRVLCLLYLS